MAPDGSRLLVHAPVRRRRAWATAWTASRSPSPARPAPNDSFELEPVGRAAVSMKRVLDDPTGIAAASPMTAVMGVGQQGHGDRRRPRTWSTPATTRRSSAAINFTDANGDYSYTLTDASGNVTSSGNGTWTPGQPIALNGFELSLNGVPASGDTHQRRQDGASRRATTATRWRWWRCATRTSSAATSRSTARCRTARPPPTPTRACWPTWACACRARKTASTISSATSAQADTAVADKSGVNLDEEAGRLIQFQQGYQAAAKVLQVAQAIFDTLLQMASALIGRSRCPSNASRPPTPTTARSTT